MGGSGILEAAVSPRLRLEPAWRARGESVTARDTVQHPDATEKVHQSANAEQACDRQRLGRGVID